jgi:hypothetical protein
MKKKQYLVFTLRHLNHRHCVVPKCLHHTTQRCSSEDSTEQQADSQKQKQKKLHGLSPRANYTDRARLIHCSLKTSLMHVHPRYWYCKLWYRDWLRARRFWRVMRGRCAGLTALPPSVSQLSTQCGILNISQPYRPWRPFAGIALLFTGWTTEGSEFSPGRIKNFHFCISSRPVMGSTQPTI